MRSMLRFLLKRYEDHDEESLLASAAEWAGKHGLTVDETLYLYSR
jgi:hypothetical protein